MQEIISGGEDSSKSSLKEGKADQGGGDALYLLTDWELVCFIRDLWKLFRIFTYHHLFTAIRDKGGKQRIIIKKEMVLPTMCTYF